MNILRTASLRSNFTDSYKKKRVDSINARLNLRIKMRFPGQKQKHIKVSEMS